MRAGPARDPALLDLSEGSRLVIGGEEWEVTCLQAYRGRVRMRPVAGTGPRTEEDVTIQALLRHPDCHPSTSTAALPASSRGRQPTLLEDLTDAQRAILALRLEHLMEAETGFRSGDPRRALPGEPRPGYDPDVTTITQRRENKAAGLSALPAAEARMLGLARVSARTLRRWAFLLGNGNIEGLINGSWVRLSTGHPSVTPEVREAIIWVRKRTLHLSRTDMGSKHVLLSGYIASTFGPDIPVPSYSTLRRVW